MAQTATTDQTIRIPAAWMRDHLDNWPNDIDEPKGEYKGLNWIGEIDADQRAEIIGRAEFYAEFSGDELRENRQLVKTAKKVLEAVR